MLAHNGAPRPATDTAPSFQQDDLHAVSARALDRPRCTEAGKASPDDHQALPGHEACSDRRAPGLLGSCRAVLLSRMRDTLAPKPLEGPS